MNPTNASNTSSKSNESSNRKRRATTSGSTGQNSNETNDEAGVVNRKSLRLSSMATSTATTVSPQSASSKTKAQANSSSNSRLTKNSIKAEAATDDSNSSTTLVDSNLDVNAKFTQSIDLINQKLNQHSDMIQKLNTSMEKIFSKIEDVLKTSSSSTSGGGGVDSSNENDTVVIETRNESKARQANLERRKQQQEKEKIQLSKIKEATVAACANASGGSPIHNDEEEDEEEINGKRESITVQQESELVKSNHSQPMAVEGEKESFIQQIKLNNEPIVEKTTNECVGLVLTPGMPTTTITTTIKLTDSEIIDDLTTNKSIKSMESSSPKLTDQIQNDFSSDSSKSDDDDDDYDYNDDSGSGNKKLRSSTSNHKAILNKTKIDTDFIASLIPNKDPNDKRYDPNEINKLRLLSHSYQNFSVKLLVRLFDEEEIIGRNVYGRNYSGDKSATKQPLDPERINFIKETVLRLTKTNNPELAWASCVIAMNRKMVDINNKFLKNNKDK